MTCHPLRIFAAAGATARAAWHRFRRDSRGAMSVEAVFVLPMLVFVYVAMFVFFDAYRTQNVALRAANTVGDLLSRETASVNPAYVEGMNGVFDYLVNSRFPTRLRVTSVGWDDNDQSYTVIWSHGTRGQQALTAADINATSDRMPMLAEGETLIVVETRVEYAPAFNVGIGPRTFLHFVPTRPRFAPQLVWAN